MTEDLIQKTKQIVTLMGFKEPRVELDEEHRKISLFIDDDLIQSRVSNVLPAMEHLLNLMVKDKTSGPYVVDLNYYRKERERIMKELQGTGSDILGVIPVEEAIKRSRRVSDQHNSGTRFRG